MYLETLLKPKFRVHTELWLIVKRWYPVLTESFNIVCIDDKDWYSLVRGNIFEGPIMSTA
jgi:hypothetical protein